MSQAITELAQQGYSIGASCQAFGLPRSNYYRLLQEKANQKQRPRPTCRVRRCSKWLWSGLATATAA